MNDNDNLKRGAPEVSGKILSQDSGLSAQLSNISEINKRLRRKIFDHYTVFEISRHLSSMLDTRSLLDSILLTCIGQMSVEGAVILLTDSESNVLAKPLARGISIIDYQDIAIDYDSEIIKFVLRKSKPLMAKEILDLPNLDYGLRKFIEDCDIRIITPMIMKNRLLGILFLPDKMSRASFYENDLEFLSLLMNQLSVALENARLYERERKINEELQQTQKLLVETEKMAALGKLSASVAHEVNNPLGIISNYLQILSRKKLPENVYDDYVKILKEEVNRIAGIVRQLLDFYRPQQERIVEVNINKVLAESISLMSNMLATSNIEAFLDIDRNLPRIKGSPEKLKQVLLNLIMNSRDAMPDGGEIRLSAHSSASEVIIEVSDSGKGIEPAVISKIFEPFYTTKQTEGTGLGLSVCYGIIQWHHGNITVFNNPDKGVTFIITLPIMRQDG